MIMFIHRGGGDLALKTGARTVGAAHLSQNHSSINQSNEKRLPHNMKYYYVPRGYTYYCQSVYR